MESQWDGGMKVLFMGFGSKDKIFGMPIYGKKPLKIFFSGLESPLTLKFDMQHLGTLALPVLFKW